MKDFFFLSPRSQSRENHSDKKKNRMATFATLPAPTSTGAGGNSSGAPVVCYNSSNPNQQVACTPSPPTDDTPFLEKYTWTIILAGVCLFLALTCIIFSCWRNAKKARVIEERKIAAKERLERKFKRELDEKKREFQLAKANAANDADV